MAFVPPALALILCLTTTQTSYVPALSLCLRQMWKSGLKYGILLMHHNYYYA